MKWNKATGQLPNRAIDDGRGLLVITDVKVTDSGRYICEASDGYSIVTSSVDLTVGGKQNPSKRFYVNKKCEAHYNNKIAAKSPQPN